MTVTYEKSYNTSEEHSNFNARRRSAWASAPSDLESI